MKFDLYTDMALQCDVPEHRLCRGDTVKLVDHNVAPDGTEGYSIEVFNALGDMIARHQRAPFPPSKPSAKMKCSAPTPCNGADSRHVSGASPGSKATVLIDVIAVTPSKLQTLL